MDNGTGQYKFVLYFLLISFFSCINPPSLFSAGREFQRTRTDYSTAGEGFFSSKDRVLEEYTIGANDEIEVFVWQNADLSKDVVVGPDGYISCPLVGRVMAAGLTLVKLEKVLTDELAKYIKYPKVSLMIKKFAGDKIMILGEINYPGVYTYSGAIDIVELVSLAGDFAQNAQRNSLIIIRRTDKEKPKAIRINALKAITRGVSEERILLKPNDIVFVPKTFIGNLNQFITDIGPVITNTSIGIDIRDKIKAIR